MVYLKKYIYSICSKVLTKVATTVTLKSGHTFNICDHCFGLIEQLKRGREVYTPNQWKELITRNRMLNPIQIAQEELYDWSFLADYYTKPEETTTKEKRYR